MVPTHLAQSAPTVIAQEIQSSPSKVYPSTQDKQWEPDKHLSQGGAQAVHLSSLGLA